MDVPGACWPLPTGELSLTFSYSNFEFQLPLILEEIELCLKAEELYYTYVVLAVHL
jgi:hypothetical protein